MERRLTVPKRNTRAKGIEIKNERIFVKEVEKVNEVDGERKKIGCWLNQWNERTGE